MTHDKMYLTESEALPTMARVQSRAVYLNSLLWPSTPWTDTDHELFKAASDKWDAEHAS